MEPSSKDNSRPSTFKKAIGPYVPPAKRVKEEKFDVGSEEHQKKEWDENKKKINGLINRANISNVTVIIKELFKCNLIRYKGLFVSALLRAQEKSPVFTDVYAAIAAVINSRIRTIGALLINRLVLQYRVAIVSNNKPRCLASVKFVAHLTNQEVVHEALSFQIIEHLLNKPSTSTIEIAIEFLKECGAKLEFLNSTYLFEVFRTLRELLERELATRTRVLVQMILDIRKNKFQDFPPIKTGLDLVDEEDRATHTIGLIDPKKEDFHMEYNYFKVDPNWVENESKYEDFKKSLLEQDEDETSDSSDGEDAGSNSDSSSSDGGEDENNEGDSKADVKINIIDKTGADLVAFRKMVYLTIKSSVRHEEVVHKLLKSDIKPEFHDELCQMIVDCCGQDRTYESIYGLVASKLCQINGRAYAPIFEKILELFYETVHRFETNKIRNISKFFAHLLTTESIDWSCLKCLKLRENATSSAGRCFIKFLFQELVAILSMNDLIEYINDPTKEEAFKELFPREPEQDIRFAINFFTFSGLGKLTEGLQQEMKALQE